MIMFAEFINRQGLKNSTAKKTWPGFIQLFATLGAKVLPGVEDVKLFVIFYVEHRNLVSC